MAELLQPRNYLNYAPDTIFLSPTLKKSVRPDGITEYSNIRPPQQPDNPALIKELSMSIYQKEVKEYNFKKQWRNNIMQKLMTGQITSEIANAKIKNARLEDIKPPEMPDWLKPKKYEPTSREEYFENKRKEEEFKREFEKPKIDPLLTKAIETVTNRYDKKKFMSPEAQEKLRVQMAAEVNNLYQTWKSLGQEPKPHTSINPDVLDRYNNNPIPDNVKDLPVKKRRRFENGEVWENRNGNIVRIK